MAMVKHNELGWNERFRRCVYFFLRDELDALLLDEALIQSFKRFKDLDKPYPFVEMKELKPKAKIIGPEYHDHRHFIVIFNEEPLPASAKNYIRFFDSNKVTKENLSNLTIFDLRETFHQRMRFFGDSDFPALLKMLIETDFAVLIQRDLTIKARYRYALSHFHVRVDWPVAQAAEDLGRNLRYISRDLYEKGDKLGEALQQKLYEHYGFHHHVGGRRTAGLVAAQYINRFDFISTVYIASAEARTLTRVTEQGIAKYLLVRIYHNDMGELVESAGISEKDFINNYLVDMGSEYGVGIFLVTYKRNEHSLPPPDGKLRELNPDYQWLNVDLQVLVPPPWIGEARPIPMSRIYA